MSHVSSASGSSGVTAQEITARLERLPRSFWHFKVRMVVGAGTFFDGFDALSIALVLPALVGLWGIKSQEIGWLISSAYAGQAIGAIFFGWLAERIGRVHTVRITVAIFGLMSLACAFAQSYEQMVGFRFLAGIGLGGEVPIAIAYVSEIAQAKGRGSFILLYELAFSIGFLAVSFVATWLVPLYGWQSLFIVGALPTLLVFVMQYYCPESPRWLASRGRLDEADKVLTKIEAEISHNGARPLPPIPALSVKPLERQSHWTELFSPVYLKRTIVVWFLWACAYFVYYSLFNWLPTMYRTIYHLSLQDSLNLALYSTLAGLAGNVICAFTIDRVGRGRWFTWVFALCAVFSLCLVVLGADKLIYLIIFGWGIAVCLQTVTFSLYLYTPEIYPTRMRSIGVSWATFWLRAASVVGPIFVGWLLPHYGTTALFVLFGGVMVIGVIVCIVGMVEGSGKVLEEVSP